jgi:hypothetical protein
MHSASMTRFFMSMLDPIFGPGRRDPLQALVGAG